MRSAPTKPSTAAARPALRALNLFQFMIVLPLERPRRHDASRVQLTHPAIATRCLTMVAVLQKPRIFLEL